MQKKMNSGLKFFKLITTCEKMVIPAAVTGQMPRVDKVVLRDGSENMWIVGMRNDGEWSFKEGWPRFYHDNSLNPNDFLVFTYNPAPAPAASVFDFKILGQNGCQKKRVSKYRIKDEPDQVCESKSNRPFFISRLRSRKTELFIPKNVVINCKLELPERLMLVDVQGNRWEAMVKQWQNGRVCCTGGAWRRLCKANNINMGDTYTCHLILQGTQHPSILVRPVDYAPTTLKPESTTKKAAKKKRVSKCRPYFLSRSRPRRHELGIPKEAIKNYDLKLPNALFLVDERGNKWKTKVKKWKDGRVLCSGGWRRLCNVNNINKTDPCICEFFLEAADPFILVRLMNATA